VSEVGADEEALITAFKEAWGWSGPTIAAVTAVNPFGHMVLRASTGDYFYFDPEELTLTQIARDEHELFRYMALPNVRELWDAEKLVEQARALLGAPVRGGAYHWKIPPILGGSYDADNMTSLPLTEIVLSTGHIGEQIKGLPDGTEIRLKVVE
jgi:hypothetical protein